MSSRYPIRLGMDLKNQMWTTGEASSMCPSRWRRALDRITSTPHLSQTTPLCLIPLNFPQLHSQSRVGPKILAQNRPSRSGLNVR